MILPYKFQFEFEDYLYYDLYIDKKVMYAKRTYYSEYYIPIGKEEYEKARKESNDGSRIYLSV